MKTKTVLLGIVLSILCDTSHITAQQRVLLRINKAGQQEVIPIRKGERTEDVLARLDKMSPQNVTGGTRDSLVNFGLNGATNFIAAHQDVMFQWFNPQANGLVLQFGWKNGTDLGTIPKSTIRAWQGDGRLVSLPVNAQSTSQTGLLGNMGYYKKQKIRLGTLPYANAYNCRYPGWCG